MLLIAAGLLLRSFVRLQSVPPGFTTDHVLTMEVAASGKKYQGGQNESQIVNFYQDIENRVARLPGVVAEGLVSALPLTGEVGWGRINVEGYTPPPEQELQVDLRVASSNYFRAMEIPLRQGRFFNDQDLDGKPNVAIIDQQFAQRFWPAGDALGKHLWFRDPREQTTIVGVVGAVKQYGLETGGKIATYFPQTQAHDPAMFLAVRTSSEVTGLASAVLSQIHEVDPDVVVDQVRTMQDRLRDSLARQRFAGTMLGAFALFALLLAAVGLYGVMSHLVTQSTHDIGVLVTLGARPGNIIGLVLRQGMQLTAIGIGAGLAGALALTRLMNTLLFDVSATDWLIFTTVPALLATVAFAATILPAWRATRVDPMVALREE
jgi:predicted permease